MWLERVRVLRYRPCSGSVFELRVVPEKLRVTDLSPKSGPVTGDTLVSFDLDFATEDGPRSRDDFVGWLDYLGSRNMTVMFTGWAGVDVDGDPLSSAGSRWTLLAWYDDATGTVQCESKSFYDEIYLDGTNPFPGDGTTVMLEIAADSMEYSTSRKTFLYYAIPTQVTHFFPRYGPDSGYTAVSVEGNNLNTWESHILDKEVRCKFGDQVGFQATFIPGTGILLCLSADFRPVANEICDEHGACDTTCICVRIWQHHVYACTGCKH